MSNFEFNKMNIYNHMYSLAPLDNNKKKLLDRLKTKYNIDYLGIHAMDVKSEYLYSTRGHDGWHNFFWKTNRIEKCKAVKALFDSKNINGLMFFNSYLNEDLLDIRAEIIGERKSGFSLLFNGTNDNKIMFCLTFKDYISLDSLNRQVLLELIDDMYKSTILMDPFLFWFKKIGNLNYTKDLEQELEKTKFVVPF
jgi:hypothetical protein